METTLPRYLLTPHPHTMLSMPLAHKHVLVLLLALVLLCPPRVHGFGVCRNTFRCFNGGVERYGTSVFSPCRCQCQQGFTGPRCQYREAYGKRSSSLSVLTQVLQARLRLEGREEEERPEMFDDDEEDDDGEDRFEDYEDSVLFLPRERGSRRRLHPRFFRR